MISTSTGSSTASGTVTSRAPARTPESASSITDVLLSPWLRGISIVRHRCAPPPPRSSEPWPVSPSRMPHGHDSHEGVLLLNLEVDVVRRTCHQDAPDLSVPDRPVRQAGLGSLGQPIEDRRSPRRKGREPSDDFSPPGGDLAR